VALQYDIQVPHWQIRSVEFDNRPERKGACSISDLDFLLTTPLAGAALLNYATLPAFEMSVSRSELNLR
jgi:hypothetical protein